MRYCSRQDESDGRVMELNKSNIKKLLFIICISLTFFWGLNHMTVVAEFLKGIINVISPFLLGLCFAFITNVIMRPVEKTWEKIFSKKKKRADFWMKIKRPVSMIISILIIVGVIFILAFMIIPEITTTIASIGVKVNGFIDGVEKNWPQIQAFLEKYAIVLPELNLDISGIAVKISEYISKIGPSFINKTVGLTGSIFSAIFDGVLGFVFSIYILSQKEKIGRNLKKTLQALLSQQRVNRIVEIATLSDRCFTNFVTGQLTEALIIGVLCFIGMKIFGMDYALAISGLIGFTALIPVFGAFIGIGVGAFLLLMVDPMKALWFVIFILVLQQVEGNLIYPRVVGKSVGLPGIWVLAAVTIGGGLFGMLGMLTGVPIVSILYALGKEAINKRLKNKRMKPLED